MMNSYLLADDLSGALEAGAAFCARGWSVNLIMGGAMSARAEAGTLTLLSTETRNAVGAAAAASVRRLLASQQAAGSRLLFKKIDSTLRGPVAAEIKALVDELAPPLVVLCPASPAVGRTVREGVLLVHGVPVADTEYRGDPGWPVTESNIVALLAAGGVTDIACLSLARLRAASQLGPECFRGVLICDAETTDDLGRLVALVRRQVPGAVFVGAGGLAHALAAEEIDVSRPVPLGSFAPQGGLFVSGSMNARSRHQLEYLRDHHAVTLHEVGLGPDGVGEAAEHVARALVDRGSAALTLVAGSAAGGSREPVRQLVAVVQRLTVAGAIPELLAATGGETAQALCDCLGIGQLVLVGEVEPGVVLTRVLGPGSGNPKWVVIKPGGFGSDEVWASMFNIQQPKK
jgi:uncharacterized protein YgbK (DUF1537 family)